MLNFLFLADEAGDNNPWTAVIIGVALVGLIALFLIMPALNNKKRKKQIDELYSSLDVGDKIKTVGGIVGTVIEIRNISAVEREIVVETGVGANKSTMVFDMQAVYQNLSKAALPPPAKETKTEDTPKEDDLFASEVAPEATGATEATIAGEATPAESAAEAAPDAGKESAPKNASGKAKTKK